MMSLKVPFYCRTCPGEKARDEFYILPSGNPRGRCKDCVKADKRDRYAEDPESYKREVKAWQDGNSQKVKGYERKCRQRRIREGTEAEKVRRWRKENPEKWRAQQRRALKVQRDRGWTHAAKRRALRRGAFVEEIDRQRVFANTNGLCGICAEALDQEDFHIDHIIPLSRGGTHEYANVQAAHPRCNRRKGTRL